MSRLTSHRGGRLSYFVLTSVALAAFVVLALPAPVTAQYLYGSLVGTVTDRSGAVVPGATVTVTQKQTSLTRTTVTDSSGGYTVSTLWPGTYDVKVEAKGFETFTRVGVDVTLNTVSRVDAMLQVGAITQTVQVTSAAPLLQTDRADVHHDISAEQINNLPMPPGNNFEQLFKTVPGLTPPASAHSVATNPSRALSFFSNGSSDLGNSIQIDGVSQWNIWVPENAAYIPSSDAIEMVNVSTNNYNIDQGLAGGTAANVQIRSGTNQIHGDAYEYHYDEAMEALPFFAPRDHQTAVPKDVYNQFGGSVGGPIKKDKLFYFSNVEFTRDYQLASTEATMPTMPMRAGDLRGLLGSIPGASQANPDVVYDPTTGDSKGNNRTQFFASDSPSSPLYNALCLPSQANSAGMCQDVIPTARLSPTAQKLLALMPQPNLLSTSSNEASNNFLGTADVHFNRFTTDDKINWNATNKFSMFGHVGYLRYDTYNPTIYGNTLGGDQASGFLGNEGAANGYTATMGITGNYVARPTLVIDGNFGFTRQVTNSAQLDLSKKEGQLLGIPGTNGSRTFEGSMPQFSISGFSVLGTQHNFMPYFRNDPQFYWSGNASWIKGSHTVRFGGALMIQHLNQQQPEWNAGGTSWPAAGGFGFGAGTTQCGNCSKGKTSSSNNFNDFASFLLGLDNGWGRNIQIPDYFHTDTREYALYVGDTWQVTRKLTATYGLRWEFYPFPTRSGTPAGVERYNFTNGLMENCGEGGNPLDCGVSVGHKYFAPRLGLAYRATNSFVVRAGYGITSDPFNLIDDIRTNYPILIPLAEGTPSSLTAAGVIDSASLQNAPAGECSAFAAFCINGALPVGIVPPNPLPSLTSASNPVPGNVNLVTTGSTVKRAYIQSWNFMLEKSFAGGWVAQAGYVATRTVNLVGWLNLNTTGAPGGGSGGLAYFYNGSNKSICTNGAASTALGCRTGATVLVTPVGNTNFDSLQATLNHHFASGFDVHLGYTWSKVIGEAGLNDEKGSAYDQTLTYYHLNRGYAPYDRPQNFEAAVIAQPPFGAGHRWVRTGIGSRLLGGWQVSSIVTAVSNTPFQLTASGSSLNMSGDSQTPDLVGPINILKQAGPGEPWFSPLAFAGVNDVRFGTAAAYEMHGPFQFNTDAELFRNFRLSERFNLQFRAEAYNLTNTPSFSNPSGSCGSLGTFGGCNNSSFGTITGVNNFAREGIGQRQFEVSARLSF